MKPLFIYHKGCRDGFTAAWVARKRYPDADFHPAQHGDTPPDVRGRTVYILDFAYPREVLERMHREAASLLVLDHHKTAEEDLRGLPYAIFDVNRSGAGLTWDRVIHFFPAERRPRLVQEGSAILRHEAALVSQIVRNAKIIEHNGVSAALVNTPVLLSEVLGELALDHDFAVGWFEQPDGGRIYSFRSDRGRGADVGAIAKAFGGGGHKHAAGVRFDAAKTPLELGPVEIVGAILRKLAATRDEGVNDV